MPFGINFSPYVDGQNPLPGTLVIKTSQVANRLKTIRNSAQWIRTYSVTHGMESTGALAHQFGFKAALGAWLGPENDSAGAGVASNQQEIASLIEAANRGEADMLIVGSEVLQRDDLPATRLLAYMQQVRSAVVNGIPVTTDDTYSALLANREAIAGSDIVMANFYPYWEGTRIDGAIASLDSEDHELAQVAGEKEIWVGETGWPSGWNAVNLAEPNPENAAYYFLAFNSWAVYNNVNAFYFEAYDESWKSGPEGPQGGRWGIRTSSGLLKEGTNLVYGGFSLPSEIFMRQILPTTLPGSPGIQLTRIPAYGSKAGIAGVVSGVQSADYAVATYINVTGSWWTKPTFADPTVPINPDGTFTCATVTGGNDADATEFQLYVVPINYVPPLAAGEPSVPAEIYLHAATAVDVPRPAGYPGSIIPAQEVIIHSFSITRNFGTSNKAGDTVSVTGDIPLANTNATGVGVTISIGSAWWQFTLAGKNGSATVNAGNCPSPSGRILISSGKASWRLSAKMQCAAGNTNWDEKGLINATIMAPGIPIFLPISITVNNNHYMKIMAVYYTAQEGGKGLLK